MKKDSNNVKKYNTTKISISIVIFIVFVILLCFFYSLIMLIIEPTKICIIENGKIYEEESAVGYIIRDETVITGENYKNGLIEIKSEGEKVAKGDNVFRYYTNNEEKLTQNIEELDLKIQDAMKSSENSIYSADIQVLDRQIEEQLYNISNTNNIEKIAQYKKTIATALTKKAKIAGELSPSGSYIKKLISQRSEYEQRLNNGQEYVKATKSGIVSYKIDGLENVLTPNDFSNLSKEFLEKIDLKAGQIISNSSESGKIVNNFCCYIAVILKSENAKEATEGKTIKIRLSNEEEIPAKIEYISSQNDNERVIVLKITKQVEELIKYRKISIDVIWWSDSGIKVPNSAIIREGDLTYVTRKRTGYTDKILVKVVRNNENFSIIENYTADELSELGYTLEEITAMKSIGIYDEIILN